MQVKHKDISLYGLRKINSLTQAKKITSFASFMFQNHLLVDLDDKQIFTIDKRIDFFAYRKTAFITDKKAFETALNFRTGMEKNRDSVLDEFLALKLFKTVEPIRKAVGSNLHFLRKVSAIQKSGYYKDSGFMAKLIDVNKSENWGLIIEDDRSRFQPNKFGRTDKQESRYDNPDNDPRGSWQSVTMTISLVGGARGRQYAKTGKSEKDMG